MIRITEREQEQIEARFKKIYVTPTRHHVFCEERPDVLRFLRIYRKTH